MRKIGQFSRRKKIERPRAQGRALNKADVVVSRVLDAVQGRYIRKLKVSRGERGGETKPVRGRDWQVGREICLTVSREITISLFHVAPSGIGLRRRKYSTRLGVIHHVIISSGNWIEVTTVRWDVSARAPTDTHRCTTDIYVPCAHM